MSNPDSFIDEVTEEVRRDRLFALMRRYGWIAILAVLALVGASAWVEWQRAQARGAAQAFGDAVLAALDAETPAARAAALAAVPAAGDQTAVLRLLLASDPAADRAAAVEALAALAADPAAPQIYRDLASLRRISVLGAELPDGERRAALEALAEPGRPFRPLAREQLAYLAVETGDSAAALDLFRALTEDQEAPAGLRARARQMITALGGDGDGEG